MVARGYKSLDPPGGLGQNVVLEQHGKSEFKVQAGGKVQMRAKVRGRYKKDSLSG